jgi:hypothetical protein
VSNARQLVEAWTKPFVTLEDTIETMILMRDVRFATGIWLTQLGSFVGQPRQGVTDDELYRRYVQARIITNKSDGQPETMYAITRKILGDTAHTLQIDIQGHCGFVMRVGGEPLEYPVATIIISFLRQAASAGVRVILEFSTLDPEDTFGFEDSDGLGFESFDETTGGGWAVAIE